MSITRKRFIFQFELFPSYRHRKLAEKITEATRHPNWPLLRFATVSFTHRYHMYNGLFIHAGCLVFIAQEYVGPKQYKAYYRILRSARINLYCLATGYHRQMNRTSTFSLLLSLLPLIHLRRRRPPPLPLPLRPRRSLHTL